GTETTNPLAVISGQAQYLLRNADRGTRNDEHTGDASIDHRSAIIVSSCQTIIAQTQRIHQILRDLMQFARPPQPIKQTVDLSVVVRETATALEDLARQREVRLEGIGLEEPIYVEADACQIRTALACLLRNAIEAAPSGPDAAGWARIQLTAPNAEHVEIIIEDNGPG